MSEYVICNKCGENTEVEVVMFTETKDYKYESFEEFNDSLIWNHDFPDNIPTYGDIWEAAREPKGREDGN